MIWNLYIVQEIEEVQCATKDNGIACDNPVQLVCDENKVKGRDGKVHEFEKLHVLERGNERTQLVKETNLDESLRQWYKLAKQGNSMFAIVDGLLVKNVYDNAGDPLLCLHHLGQEYFILLMRVQDIWVLRSAIP